MTSFGSSRASLSLLSCVLFGALIVCHAAVCTPSIAQGNAAIADALSIQISTDGPSGLTYQPPTVHNFAAQSEQELSIDEAVLIALDNNPDLQMLSFDVPLWNTRVSEMAAEFDPTFSSSGFYRRADDPLSSQVTAAGTTATSQLNRDFMVHPDHAENLSYSRKLPQGAMARLGFSLPYEAIHPAGEFRIVNPAWRSGISATIDQPLLRGSGVKANQAKIEIARQYYCKSQKDTQLAMNRLARDVRVGYWNLAYAFDLQQVQLEAVARGEAMVEQERKKLELGSSNRANLAQAIELLSRYRIAELDTRHLIVEFERLLRASLGIPGFDGSRLRLTNQNVDDEGVLPWDQALPLAMSIRPELAAQRHRLQAARTEIDLRRNEMLPDLNVLGRLSTTGLSTNLDQAVSNSFEFDHTEAAIGFSYRRNVNQTQSRSMLRRAQLMFAQEEAMLRKLEYDAEIALQRSYQNLVARRERLSLTGTRVSAARELFEISLEQFKTLQAASVDYLLRSQEALTEAELERAQAVADFRKSVEDWDYQCGGLLTRWDVEADLTVGSEYHSGS